MIGSWTDLIDRSYADLCISVRCAGTNFREYLAKFDFAPLVEVTRADATREDLDFERSRYFVDADNVDAYRRGTGCKGYVAVMVNEVECELHSDATNRDSPAHARTMDLLRFLVREEDWPWRWTGYSMDPATGQTSEHRQGVLVVALPHEG